MTIVLTNDDGLFAPGITQLAAAFRAAGLPVVVVAPEANQSGVSRAANYTNPVRVAAEAAGPDTYLVAGTPVDCVRVALAGGLVPDVDLVVAGVNHGLNAGDDIYNSGTVGAAIEAALFGIPAIAISQQEAPGDLSILGPVGVAITDFSQSARYGVALARATLESTPPARTVLNVNVPAQPAKGLTTSRLGKRLYGMQTVKPLAQQGLSSYFLVYGGPDDKPIPCETAPGTDFGALLDGFVAISPVSFDHDPQTRGDTWTWAEQLAGRAEALLQ